jgi:hypothetical protein
VSFAKYALSVLGLTAVSMTVVWPMLESEVVPDPRLAVLLAAGLTTLNTIAAYGLVLWSSGRSTKAFMRAVLGGMLARMFLMLVAVVTAIQWLELPALPFVVALLAYFVTFQIFELAILQRRGRALREEMR